MAERIFYTMGEVAEMFDVNTSLIRHWETQFPMLRPKRNKKGNRLFTPQDVEYLKMIYHLVKECGMTLDGAKKALRKGSSAKGLERDTLLMEHLQRIRAMLVEVREELKAPEGELVGDDEDLSLVPEAPEEAKTLSASIEKTVETRSGETVPEPVLEVELSAAPDEDAAQADPVDIADGIPTAESADEPSETAVAEGDDEPEAVHAAVESVDVPAGEIETVAVEESVDGLAPGTSSVSEPASDPEPAFEPSSVSELASDPEPTSETMPVSDAALTSESVPTSETKSASDAEPTSETAREAVPEPVETHPTMFPEMPVAEKSASEATDEVAAVQPEEGPGQPTLQTMRKSRRKKDKDEVENKELFAFYEQSLF